MSGSFFYGHLLLIGSFLQLTKGLFITNTLLFLCLFAKTCHVFIGIRNKGTEIEF